MRRAGAQLGRPVKRRVTTANDHHPLADEGVGIGDYIMNATPVPRFGARLRQPTRFEGTDTGGNDDGARGEAVGFGDQHVVIVFLLECDNTLTEVSRQPRFAMKLRRLLGEVFHQVFGEHLGITCHIEDVFFGIQRRELSTKFGERVNYLCRRATHAGIEQCEQPGRAATNNGDISNHLEK